MAVERVERQLREVTAALDAAGVPYAVVGGNAVAAWVSTIDPDAVRTTKDVDLLVSRSDLERISAALTPLGYIDSDVLGVRMFLPPDRPNPRSGVHLVYAGERVRPEHDCPAPGMDAVETGIAAYRVVSLPALVRMKLTAWRRLDMVHLRDMLDVGLFDAAWVARLEPPLAARLQELIDNPE